jgi:NDP-sugar pyrophosphorylase family protein
LNEINVLIPMAGLGSRFSQVGYEKPKPLIDVNGVPMIKAVVDSLGISGRYIYIVQKEHSIRYDLPTLLNNVSPGCSVIEIDGQTDGAARTTLMAKHLINNDTPLIIANSDQIVSWDSDSFVSLLLSSSALALFKSQEPKWSYSEVEDDKVLRVAEKIVISENANVGIYGWNMGSDYVKYAEQMISKNIKTNNEFYVAPTYNEAIEDGKNVVPFFIDKMYGVGTPEDLEEYLENNRS